MKRVNSVAISTLLLSTGYGLFAQTTGVGNCGGSKNVGCVLPNIYNGDDGIRLPRATPGEHEAHFLETSGYTQNFLPLNKAIATQLALLPIVSPASGFTYSFDKSTGAHTRTAQSFGPSTPSAAKPSAVRRCSSGSTTSDSTSTRSTARTSTISLACSRTSPPAAPCRI